MSQLSNQSFNDAELSNGYHLLTDSSHIVKVNTPPVPSNSTHLYPRLAGSNWTSYLSQPRVVLGRSGTTVTSLTSSSLDDVNQQDQRRSRKQQRSVDVDLGDSKAISRRHCEIRFSVRRDRWELYVYGRNGVKINHVIKKPGDKPSVLKSSDLIEIDHTSFVFILPNNNNYLKPRIDQKRLLQQQKSNDSERQIDSEVNTPKDHDISTQHINHELEIAVVKILEKNNSLNTKEIMEHLDKQVDKENLLRLLVLSSRFHLAPNSISISSKESDSARWMLIPTTTNYTAGSTSKDSDISPVKIIDNDVAAHHQQQHTITSKDNSNQLTSTSSEATTPLSTTTILTTSQLEEGEKMNYGDPFSSVSPSFPKLINEENDWSVFMPNTPKAAATPSSTNDTLDQKELETTTRQEEERQFPSFSPSPLSPVPQANLPSSPLFHGISIESTYLIWTSLSSSSSFAVTEDSTLKENNERPNKRLKMLNLDHCTNDSACSEKGPDEDELKLELKASRGENIFKETRTKILIQ
ncbi:MAG: hypothetical protein EXX96DRAFT_565328 [Benjaminiella poitrasii]|nr:MAG: hypothetical protein EXX96DRAFT_565328 [Benjaminiella poitrasii]